MEGQHMNLIEIACPAGSIDDDQRRLIAADIVANFLVEPTAPAEAIERAGRATHVWFQEARAWTTGSGPYEIGAAIPFVVTISVPEAWREELTRHAMGAVRVALIRHVPPGLLADDTTWINVVGVMDGSIGMNGRPTTSTDIVRHLTQGIQPPEAAGLPDGVVIDPVCGMQVHLGRSAITLESDGRTIGFCATGCRRVYAQDHDIQLN
jgi:YHS domain-containing protein